jgi:hypothetical protein
MLHPYLQYFFTNLSEFFRRVNILFIESIYTLSILKRQESSSQLAESKGLEILKGEKADPGSAFPPWKCWIT